MPKFLRLIEHMHCQAPALYQLPSFLSPPPNRLPRQPQSCQSIGPCKGCIQYQSQRTVAMQMSAALCANAALHGPDNCAVGGMGDGKGLGARGLAYSHAHVWQHGLLGQGADTVTDRGTDRPWHVRDTGTGTDTNDCHTCTNDCHT